jgi:hypothetical protein
VHDVGVILTREDVPRSTHVGCQLINFVEETIDSHAANMRIAQVSYQKIICRRLAEVGILEIHTANPKTLFLQAPNQVRSYEPTGSAHKRRLHLTTPFTTATMSSQ